MTAMPERGHALVRMYNVGFGDSFLLVLPDEPRPRRVLIDCGTHLASARPRPIPEVVQQIVDDVREPDGTPHIDVVVATHRHSDHISGFDHDAWAEVEVTEVWMPWTEDPEDENARAIRERQSSAARHLLLALRAPGAEASALALAQNSLTNAAAMKTLHDGFAGPTTRRFLAKPEQGVATIETPALPEARVHVLGPSRDAPVIRDMNPPAAESYLRMIGRLSADGAHSDQDDLPPPFGEEWVVENRTLATTERLKHILLEGHERAKVERHAEQNLLALAVSLEKAVNGTSLVLAFEVGDAVLLFPGDAQWGTWLGILEDPEARDVLDRTTFLKIGHHGSHNATPRRAVEALAGGRRNGSELWAMVSTHPVDMWKHIPKPELLDAIAGVAPHLARSDMGAAAVEAGFAHGDELYVDASIPIRSPNA